MRRTNLYGLRFSEDLGGTLLLKEDRAIQDAGYGLRRGPLSRTRVNRAVKTSQPWCSCPTGGYLISGLVLRTRPVPPLCAERRKHRERHHSGLAAR
jgi:hypothetical protein